MKKIVIDNISDYDYQRLLKQRDEDGFKEKGWKPWFLSKAAGKVNVSEEEGIRRATGASLRKMWGENIGQNLHYIHRKDMKSLRDIVDPPGDSVLVVGGGPSIELHNQLDTLRDSNYKGVIVTCDRMLIPLLSKGIIPDYVVSVDGSPIIQKFFKNKLVKENLPKLKILLHIATNPGITRWLYRNKANIYWFLAHSVYASDAEIENSDAIVTLGMTSSKWHPKGIQTIPAGGNVGVASWALSWVILHKKKLALIGFDMGYPEGTPLQETYYYSTYLGNVQGNCGKGAFANTAAQIPYTKEYNPAWKSYSLTDDVFRSYRKIFEGFLSITPKDVEMWSCVEGGTLYHPRLKYATLQDWLQQNA